MRIWYVVLIALLVTGCTQYEVTTGELVVDKQNGKYVYRSLENDYVEGEVEIRQKEDSYELDITELISILGVKGIRKDKVYVDLEYIERKGFFVEETDENIKICFQRDDAVAIGYEILDQQNIDVNYEHGTYDYKKNGHNTSMTIIKNKPIRIEEVYSTYKGEVVVVVSEDGGNNSIQIEIPRYINGKVIVKNTEGEQYLWGHQ